MRRKLVQSVIAVVALKFLIAGAVVAQELAHKNSSSDDSTIKPCVLVFGAVGSPARFELKRKVRLAEAVALAGGATRSASADVQVVHTGNLSCAPEPKDLVASGCVVCRPTNFPVPRVDIYKLSTLVGEDEQANPFLQSGDIVVVIEAPRIYVVGNVLSPQGIVFVPGMTLIKAIELAGGMLRDSNKKRIRVIRTRANVSGKEEIIVDWNRIGKRGAEDLALEPYDIVEVPMKGVHQHPRPIRLVSPEPQFPVRIIN